MTTLRSDLIRLPRKPLWIGLLCLTILGIAGWLAACRPISDNTSLAPARPYVFYLFNPFAQTKLVPIDAQTLKDQPLDQAITAGKRWVISGDGSTLVNMEGSWVVVRDLPSGVERSRLQPPAQVFPLALIPDNSTRLLLEPYQIAYSPIAEWYVMDIGSGQLLTHIKDAQRSCWRGTGWFAPASLQRIYCLEYKSQEQPNPLQPLHIIAYDLASGALAGEVSLPEILMGSTPIQPADNSQPVEMLLEPAIAISPDGRKLAIVHADAEKVTLLDAASLTVVQTLVLHRPKSVLEWFTPAVAHAKGIVEGVIRQAVFSADGEYLYIFQQELSEEPAAERGLQRVDLQSGAIVAQALGDYQIQWIQPAPDGSVFVFGTSDKNLYLLEIRESSPSTLWRLDGHTLQVLAQREFTGYRGSRLVLPAAHSATRR